MHALTSPGIVVILGGNVTRKGVRMRLVRFSCLSFFLMLAAAPDAGAQVLYGSIRGTVEDPGHSVIPGASVTITNRSAGTVQSTVTNSTGAYSFANTLPGVYNLTVNAPGFKSYTQTDVEVTINNVTHSDVQLQVGQVSERIEVSAEAAALQTDKADVHVELGSKEVSELPLPAYRNYQSLLNLVPGATPAIYQN